MCNHLQLCLSNFVCMCPSVNVYMSVYLCMYKGVCLHVCVCLYVCLWECVKIFQFKNLWTESKIFRNNMLSPLHFRFNWEQLTKSVFLKYLIILYQIYQNLEYIWDSPILVNPLTLQGCIMRVRFCFFIFNNKYITRYPSLAFHSQSSLMPHHACLWMQALSVPWSCWLWSQGFLCVLSQLLWEPQMSLMSENHSVYTEERWQLHTKFPWYPCLLHVLLKPVPIQLMFIHSFLDS